MFPLMERNIALNSLNHLVKAAVYDWGSPAPSSLPSCVDVILAADCVYFEPAFPLLLRTMTDLIGPNTICYFCFKKRRRADMGFIKQLKKVFEVRSAEPDELEQLRYGKENLFL
jgi:protein N-lysine methyltransferase METTL21A